jgi:putative ABC transport system substrate-binding protein
MRRREFIGLVGAAAVTCPLAARAQQQATLVVGFLNSGTAKGFATRVAAFRHALAENGYVENKNVEIEYRWAESHYERLPSLAAELVGRNVELLVATANAPAALAAKQATATIPIVFLMGNDPVRSGIVSSLNRTASNMTGFGVLSVETGTKSIQLLVEMVPRATTIGMLINPLNPSVQRYKSDAITAAATLGKKLVIGEAENDSQIDEAFSVLVRRGADALCVGSDTLFNTQPSRLTALAFQHKLPAIFAYANYVEAGGLMSYGPDPFEGYRAIGIYAARILKGEKPADLPVLQSTKFEFVINLQTARELGIEVAPAMLSIADEVIE